MPCHGPPLRRDEVFTWAGPLARGWGGLVPEAKEDARLTPFLPCNGTGSGGLTAGLVTQF